MEIDETVSFILSLPEVEECQPFGPDVLVYKVAGKMFATASEDKGIGQMNLKCDPDLAQELRDSHDWIIPGYHMNKKHWNTIVFEHGVNGGLVIELIKHSYDLVIKEMTKAQRAELRF